MNSFERICFALVLLAVASSCAVEKIERTIVNEPSAWQLRLIDDKGIDDPDNVGVGRVIAHGDFLYLGTWNNESGAKMYRSRDGESWELMGSGPFTGNKNDFVVVSIVGFGEYLYVGTWNQADGAAMFRTRIANKDASQTIWEQVTVDGFGNPRNTGFTHMREFKGYLYAGCFNYEEGSEVWRSETGEPGSWQMVIPKGWNTEGNTDSTVMLVHDGYLYIGTESARSKKEVGPQLWRTDGELVPPYDQWQQVNTNGFGNPSNHNICGLGELNGRIYAGTWNETEGIEVWRATPTESVPFRDWEKVNRNGFGNPNYSHTSAMASLDGKLFISGFKWEGWLTDAEVADTVVPGTAADSVFAKTSDGLTWDIITRKGFMEKPMAGVMWIEAFEGKIYVGGHARNGSMQLWVYEAVNR
jgi:hypothetical protein